MCRVGMQFRKCEHAPSGVERLFSSPITDDEKYAPRRSAIRSETEQQQQQLSRPDKLFRSLENVNLLTRSRDKDELTPANGSI